MLSKSILKALVVAALIAGCGANAQTIVGGEGVEGLIYQNAPTSTTTTTPHSMLSPDQQSKHIATVKGEQSKNSIKAHSEKKTHSENNTSGSSSQKLNTK
jgi:ABC-type glycerol-3-phosphate transport system substrate-binding protein